MQIAKESRIKLLRKKIRLLGELNGALTLNTLATLSLESALC